MPDSHDDRVHRLFSSLESDLAGISLPGPSAARRRAVQRTRHQVTGGVLAGVAAVALGVLAISPPDLTATPEPVGPVVDSETPTAIPTTPPTPPVEPSPDPSGDQDTDTGGGQDGDDPGTGSLAVPPGALLTVADVAADTSEEWIEVAAGDSWLPCVPRIPEDGDGVAYESPYGSRIEQFVEPAAGGAEARLEELRNELVGCAESDADFTLIQVWSVAGVGDSSYLVVWAGPPTTPDTQTYVTASLVRTSDFVSAVFFGGPGQDYNGAAQPRQAVLAIKRLCGALSTACPAAPEPTRLYPEAVGDIDGWLTADDLAEAGLTLSEGSEISDDTDEYGPVNWGHYALPGDPLADGAERLEQRLYSDPLDPTGESLYEMLATFPDDATARAHYDSLVTEADTFDDGTSVASNAGTVEGDGYTATAWVLDSGEFGGSVYGVALAGNVIVKIDPGGLLEPTPELVLDLLDLAAQQIGG